MKFIITISSSNLTDKVFKQYGFLLDLLIGLCLSQEFSVGATRLEFEMRIGRQTAFDAFTTGCLSFEMAAESYSQ